MAILCHVVAEEAIHSLVVSATVPKMQRRRRGLTIAKAAGKYRGGCARTTPQHQNEMGCGASIREIAEVLGVETAAVKRACAERALRHRWAATIGRQRSAPFLVLCRWWLCGDNGCPCVDTSFFIVTVAAVNPRT